IVSDWRKMADGTNSDITALVQWISDLISRMCRRYENIRRSFEVRDLPERLIMLHHINYDVPISAFFDEFIVFLAEFDRLRGADSSIDLIRSDILHRFTELYDQLHQTSVEACEEDEEAEEEEEEEAEEDEEDLGADRESLEALPTIRISDE
ncbi:hypothetical protein KI387_027656, partial [Taxus chinensis]